MGTHNAVRIRVEEGSRRQLQRIATRLVAQLLLDGDDFSAVSLLDRKRAAGFELLFDRGESFQRQIHIGLRGTVAEAVLRKCT